MTLKITLRLEKKKTLNEIENACSVWQNVCNLKFDRVFDGRQVMNIAFLTDDEKQNAEINCPYKLNNLSHELGRENFFVDFDKFF